ncbi:hypothetical protein [Pseudobacteriovorax antillogorgiicola]|uniref:Uncharacterized protein n=1 Tax=Pseudobacteriovorax antillogorgiicola TaxID=1513793 RepID=A0A1Y6C2X2_9BACT|nr:hypothetical protein [Pseudobacteriovorax antillogorgiicola]TCS50700.1 hypothetical protein EDD56_11283 [Pseudobacteriovorax antillogorgiicola]SMF40504.1 hypothetical protein SAMN06296036_11282 [Pseudobacteriovorax antillogorgiicola]
MTSEELIKSVETTLDEANSRVAELSKNIATKFDEATEASKTKITGTIADLKSKRDIAEEKLEELRNSSASASEDVKIGVKFAWDDLKTAVNSASERF